MDHHTIRPARPGEEGALTAIAHAAKRHWGYPEAWIAAWQADLTVSETYLRNHPVFVSLSREGGPQAFAALARLPDAPGEWELDHLWVLPEAMGRGHGAALLRRACVEALEQGATRLRILSDPNAEPFYRRFGAVRSRRVAAPVEGQERWLPELWLPLAPGPPGSAASAESA